VKRKDLVEFLPSGVQKRERISGLARLSNWTGLTDGKSVLLITDPLGGYYWKGATRRARDEKSTFTPYMACAR
jgi:hypothetical protein